MQHLQKSIVDSNKHYKPISLHLSCLLLFGILAFIILGYEFMEVPLEGLLIISAIIISLVAIYQGHTFNQIQDEIVNKFAQAMPSLMIVLCVGGVIGIWVSCGTIPYLIWLGLKSINPQYLLVISFLVTCIVSMSTGTSWGSVGTIGVAMMGVAVSMNANLAAVAGALVGGAYFGDKYSPLSGSSNFAAVVNNINLYEHIRHLTYTTIPAFLVSLAVYIIIGFNSGDVDVATSSTVESTIQEIESLYHLNWFLLIPVIIVLVGAIIKKPVVPVLLLATTIGLFIAIFYQGVDFKTSMQSIVFGFKVDYFITRDHVTVSDSITTLLNRGGINSMMSTTLIIICAFSFAGPLVLTKILNVILNKFTQIITSAAGLMLSCITSAVILIAATGNNNIASLLPSELFREAYEKKGLHRKNIARTVEDAGTVIEPLLPWTAAGAYMAATLHVNAFEYFPWAIQCYAGLIFAIIYAITGKCIAKTDDKKETTS